MIDPSKVAALPWLVLGFAVTQLGLFLFYSKRPAWRRYRLGSRFRYVLEMVPVLIVTTGAYLFIEQPEEVALTFGLASPVIAGGAVALLRANEDARALGYVEGLRRGEDAVREVRARLAERPQVDPAAQAALLESARSLERAREEAERHLEEA